MMFPNRKMVERLRREFPVGCRIVLDEMNNPFTRIPVGSQAVVTGVDDAGNVQCLWDCGSSLSLAYGADRAHRVASEAEVKQSLDWLGNLQRGATGGGHCPRCGWELESFSHHAISRYADVVVCDDCGTAEALECAGLIAPIPLTDWWCTEGWGL